MPKLTIEEISRLKKVSGIAFGIAAVVTIVINCIIAGASDKVFWGVGWVGVVLALGIFGSILYLLFRCDDMGNPCCHLSLAIMLLFSFGPIFFGIHYGIFHDFTSPDWTSTKCTYQPAVTGAFALGSFQSTSFAQEDYYPLAFTFDGGKVGCGCLSDRSRFMTIDASPYPYVLKNNEATSEDGSETFHQTFLRSWVCAENSSSNTKKFDTDETFEIDCLYRTVGDEDEAKKSSACPTEWDKGYYEISIDDESGHAYYPTGDMVTNFVFDYTGFLLGVVYLIFSGLKAIPALKVKEKRRIE